MSDETGGRDRRNVIPIPTDLTIEQYSLNQMESHKELFQTFLDDLKLTVEETKESGQPDVFAYVKMVRYFTDYLQPHELVQIAATALWRAHQQSEQQKESN